ncbi:MAG TPA: hydantoinase/oxoprolinase family protein [Solirubrobacteraceae bacterium]|nr:hydantoinase/oxoprolinase family protein [Solirubrobacteraceae bacterium]
MAYRLGVDVGGTFTDVLVLEEERGTLTLEKVLSTPEDQSVGVLEGVRQACRRLGVEPSELDAILHGSTVVTNLILEGKGATGGLLTTQGHEQILHLARAWTPGPLYGWMGMIKPSPVVELWRTRTVSARMSAAGQVVRELDEGEVRAALEELVAQGIESLTIAFLNSYVNPEHEQRARDIALAAHPDLPVSISSDLVSEYREYERTLTAVLNAYAKPQVAKYVDHLESSLNEAGFSGRLDIVRSDGGTMSVASTKDRPIDIAFSGPSGGAVGAAYLAREIDLPDVLTIDMGGTSTDVALCQGGTPPIKRDAQLGYYQFQSRSVDIHSVGAGGGSIAYLTAVGSLRVGPRSAGAAPGPACYGRGGTEPTVTDANVVLHRIPPGALLADTLQIDEEAAKRAVQPIADGLGIELTAAAEAILSIANENMHAALRVVSVERGYDPRDFGLIAFGGAGPLHANALGRLIHADPIVIPPTPGVLSAFGFLASDVQNEFARTYLRILEETPADALAELLRSLRAEGDEWLAREGIADQARAFEFFADCRYHMQDIQIPCRLGLDELSNGYAGRLREQFEGEHRRRYGFDLDVPIEIATIRCVGKGERPLKLSQDGTNGAASGEGIDRHERVFFDGEWLETPVYERRHLRAGQVIDGPAVVVQQDTTAVVEPRYRAVVDGYSNLIIREAGRE